MEIRSLIFGRSQFWDDPKGQIQLIKHNLEIESDHTNKDRAITILEDNWTGMVHSAGTTGHYLLQCVTEIHVRGMNNRQIGFTDITLALVNNV